MPVEMTPTADPTSGRSDAIVVGAGFGGIAASIELMTAGYDVTVLEAGPEIGGTWHYNDYPGAACDVPSHFYSFSFAQRATWTRFCSPQAEILGYLRETADKHGVSKVVVTDARVSSCAWDDDAREWQVTYANSAGEVTVATAGAVVIATGQLNQPATPRLPGHETFTGHTFHSARWDHDYDLRGKRVAVVGTGASAVQFVPQIAPEVGRLTVFQRTGNWFMPRENKPYRAGLMTVFERFAVSRAAYRRGLYLYMELLTALIRHPRTLGRIGAAISTAFMKRQVPDPELRAKIWPNYAFGCKRVLFSSKFLPALQLPNVELVTDGIAEVTPTGITTVTGQHIELDCIIWGTGFKTTQFMFPMEITGVDGRSLRDVWGDEPHAHYGMCVPGFPSLFILYGPNTNTSGGSVIFFLEAQAGYVRQALQLRDRQGAAAVDVRADVESAGDHRTQAAFTGTAWTQCNSWYRNDTGRIVTNWPGYMRQYAAATAAPDPADFALIEAR